MLRQKGGGGMELRVLKYFLVVAREENITKAAQLLHGGVLALLAVARHHVGVVIEERAQAAAGRAGGE